jgi:hypothetical protein
MASMRSFMQEESLQTYGEKYELNFELNESSPYSLFMLHEYLITEIEETRRMVLFHVEGVEKSEYRNRTFYRFTVCENPGQLLKDAIWFPNKRVPYIRCTFYIERKPTNMNPQKIFQVKFSGLEQHVESPLLGRVDVVKIHNVLNLKNYAMPPEFYKVMKGMDSKCRWHIKAGENYQFFKSPPEVITVMKEVVKKQIPKHIFDIVVKQSIEKEDCCPVMLIPFTKENASCGPCGHLVSYEALLRCVQDKEQCPVCREKILLQDIQKM